MGSGGKVPRILNLGTKCDEWTASRLGHFTPGESALVTQWVRGWVGTGTGLEAVARRKKIVASDGNWAAVVQLVF
jgi:hypothetical protein